MVKEFMHLKERLKNNLKGTPSSLFSYQLRFHFPLCPLLALNFFFPSDKTCDSERQGTHRGRESHVSESSVC
jgi:hypothetical protein